MQSMQNDKITLRDAMENPAWLMVYAGEPGRNIDVTMTYADLFAIYQWAKKLPRKDAEGAEKAEHAKIAESNNAEQNGQKIAESNNAERR